MYKSEGFSSPESEGFIIDTVIISRSEIAGHSSVQCIMSNEPCQCQNAEYPFHNLYVTAYQLFFVKNDLSIKIQ